MSTLLFHSLLADLPLSFQPLPGVRFFQPNKFFIDYMTKMYEGLEIWDIGAGTGFVANELSKAGMHVVALDMLAREEPFFPVLISNSVTQQYPREAVMLFCRPCHGGFVEATIYQGLRCGVRNFVYAGLAKNVGDDLSHFRRSFKRILTEVGLENESLYTWSAC